MAEQQFEYDVFLSHASADKVAVRELAERLKGDGLRVWLDEWAIQPGDHWPAKIEEGLERSRTMVVVWSKAFATSEWCRYERLSYLFREPTNPQRRFIPLRLDDCDIKDSLRQFADIDWREKTEHQYDRLLAICRAPEASSPDHHAGSAKDDPAEIVSRYADLRLRTHVNLDESKKTFSELLKELYRFDANVPDSNPNIQLEDAGRAAEHFRRFGDCLRTRGERLEAERAYDISRMCLQRRSEMNGSEQGKRLSSIAEMHLRLEPRDLEKAREAAEQSLKIHARLADDFEQFQSCRILGDIFLAQGEYRFATESIAKAQTYWLQSGAENHPVRRRLYGWVERTAGNIAMMEGRYEDAEVCFNEAKLIFEREAEGIGYAIALQKLGLLNEQVGRQANAQRFMNEAIEQIERIPGAGYISERIKSKCLDL